MILQIRGGPRPLAGIDLTGGDLFEHRSPCGAENALALRANLEFAVTARPIGELEPFRFAAKPNRSNVRFAVERGNLMALPTGRSQREIKNNC
jgi:hypothetical protein